MSFQACTDDSNCVAYGWDSSGNRCWLHTKQADIDGRSDTLANYKTYIRENCGEFNFKRVARK